MESDRKEIKIEADGLRSAGTKALLSSSVHLLPQPLFSLGPPSPSPATESPGPILGVGPVTVAGRMLGPSNAPLWPASQMPCLGSHV